MSHSVSAALAANIAAHNAEDTRWRALTDEAREAEIAEAIAREERGGTLLHAVNG